MYHFMLMSANKWMMLMLVQLCKLNTWGVTWFPLEPSRVVFRSFRGLNHSLSSVSLFGVFGSDPRSCFLNKSSCSHIFTKAHGIH